MDAVINNIDAIIDNFAATLLSVFAILWAPLCVAAFVFFVVYALWPSNWKKFFTTTRPTSSKGICADRSSNP